MPKTIAEVKIFPKLFDTYYSDHFGLRNWFTKYYKVTLLHKYQIKDIIVAIIYQANDLVMSKKQRYKVRNWKEYNEALVKRGSLRGKCF